MSLLALCGRGHLPRAGEGVGGPVLKLHDLTQHGVQEQLAGHRWGHHHLRVGLLGEDHGLWGKVQKESAESRKRTKYVAKCSFIFIP